MTYVNRSVTNRGNLKSNISITEIWKKGREYVISSYNVTGSSLESINHKLGAEESHLEV